jgi:hypothetical protein
VEVNNSNHWFKISDLLLNNMVKAVSCVWEFPVQILGPEADSCI